MKTTLFVIFGILSILLLSPSAEAEIYYYVDKHGVRHFSNTPTNSKFKLYMREKSQRQHYRHYRAINNTAFDPIIKKASRKYGLDSALIKAVISAESSFNPHAVSPKGAKGLMQIMPQNYPSLSISNPFNPAQNIMGGTKYLRKMIENFNGKVSLALAAYNAGPHAVEKYRGVPPYKETQNYVVKVMSLYRQFKKM